MSADESGSSPDNPVSPIEAVAPEPAWKRKARLAAVFGDVLPESTGDDRDEQRSSGTSEKWLKRQVPPHHG